MRVTVNGVSLFFDVEGAKLVPDGPRMREKPTLLLLHGGPGMDHTPYKPACSRFADIAQVVYLDQRGSGRSDRADASSWNLGQWGDDVRAFCDALEIEGPIVLGASFGGIVAQSYAARHPGHPSKLILASTEARAVNERTFAVFERLGGAEARDVAERFLTHGDTDALAAYVKACLPLYTRRQPMDADVYRRSIANPDVLAHYFRIPDGEASVANLLPSLSRIECPTLILAGDDDPITPAENSRDMAAAMRPGLARLVRYPHTGHTVFDDEPASYDAVREFILA